MICTLFLIGCFNNRTRTEKQEEEHTKNQNSNVEFKDLLSEIRAIEIPYMASCYSNFERDYDIDMDKYHKFLPEEMEYIYKKAEINEDIVMILYLAPAEVLIPIIRTYKSDGKEIDSEQLFDGNCSGEPGYLHNEHILIENYNTIIKIDSVLISKIDEDLNPIDSTKELNVTKQIIRIENDGTISKE